MSSTTENATAPEIPSIINDPISNTTYTKGRFLGKGGFAKCYEITDMKTGKIYAGKIVSKQLLKSHSQKEKMFQEIEIQRSLRHKHIVDFVSFFDDSNFVYVVLELCRRRSMMELHRRRKALSEPEVRYFMRQILYGVLFVHESGVIHRDLKLGNLFLNDNMEVKIGDFGLATRIKYAGQRKKTLCGTPNYIAPEILNKKGHSFEVDVWSIGCIMYTLLVGKPPFETSTLKETYMRIKRCEYVIPAQLQRSHMAVDMIKCMLESDPAKRSTVKALLGHPFFKTGYLPSTLPVSCLTMAPRFDSIAKEKGINSPNSLRKPLIEINSQSPKEKPNAMNIERSGLRPVIMEPTGSRMNVNENRQQSMKKILTLLQKLVDRDVPVISNNPVKLEEMSDPDAQPFFWISKWVDYSDKYGFGYQLNDDSVGVMFNDRTKIVLLKDEKNVHYFEIDGQESYFTIDSIPSQLEKKRKLLVYFTRYMTEHLMKTGGAIVPVKESDRLSRIPYVNFWVRSTTSVMMCLTDGIMQLNFMDHTKMILCPSMEAITYIDAEKNFRTYRVDTIAKTGCTKGMLVGIKYAYNKVMRHMAGDNF